MMQCIRIFLWKAFNISNFKLFLRTNPINKQKIFYFWLTLASGCSLFSSVLKSLHGRAQILPINMKKMLSVPEFIDSVFAKTCPKRSFSMTENERFWLVFAKTGSINSGTEVVVKIQLIRDKQESYFLQ